MTNSAFTAAGPPTGFACPNCAEHLAYGTPDCPSCGMHLTGPEAARLWEIHQELAALGHRTTQLREEEERLTALLLVWNSKDAATVSAALASGADPTPPPASVGEPLGQFPQIAIPPLREDAPAPKRPHVWSAERLFLGLGALLLLSGSIVFIAVAWSWLGLVGQAAVMLALTAVATGLAVVFERRKLTAAAVTFSLLAVSLIWCDLVGARLQGLPGVEAFGAAEYVMFCGAFAVAFSAALGRAVGAYAPLFRTTAAIGVVIALSATLFAVDPQFDDHSFSLTITLTIIAAASVAAALIDRKLPGSNIASGLIYWWNAGDFVVAAAVSTTVQALNPGTDWSTRAVVAAVAILWPVTGYIAGRAFEYRHTTALTSLLAIAVAWIVLPGLPDYGWCAVAVAVAAAVVLRPRMNVVTLVAATATLGFLELLALDSHLALGVTAAALATVGIRLALVRRSVGWLAGAELAVLAAVVRLADLHHSPATWLAVGTAYTLGHLVLARAAAGDATRFGRGLEIVGVGAAGLSALFTFAAVSPGNDWLEAFAWLGVAVGLSIYATAPQRSFWIYGAAAAWVATAWTMPHAEPWQVVEAYSAPAAVALAVTGWWQHRRTPSMPTLVTMAPSLIAGFAPTTIVAVSDGDSVRLVVTTTLAVIALAVGVYRHWQAPIAVAAVVLTTIAVTQGGPWVAATPAWLSLSLAGIALLTLGVRWEAAVKAGRRTGDWIAALR